MKNSRIIDWGILSTALAAVVFSIVSFARWFSMYELGQKKRFNDCLQGVMNCHSMNEVNRLMGEPIDVFSTSNVVAMKYHGISKQRYMENCKVAIYAYTNMFPQIIRVYFDSSKSNIVEVQHYPM